MKFCSTCGTEKPLVEFDLNSSSKDGHRSRCKDCRRIENATGANGPGRDAYKARTVEQMEAAYVRIHAKTDGLKRCQSCREWKPRDRYHRAALRPDGCHAYCKDCMSAKRYSREVTDYWEEWDMYSCVYCGKPFEEVEHVIPRALGGTNDVRNLVPSCVDCNRGPGGKHDLSPVEWMRLKFPELLAMPVIFEITLTPSELAG